MALDIMQLILQALRVQDLAYDYPSVVDQFIYLVFLPSLITIAIVYLFMNRVFSSHAGLKFLFTFALYIFILIYPPNSDKSLYTAIVPLGKLWFLGIAIVAILWFVFKYTILGDRGGGASGGGKSGSPMPGLGGGLFSGVKHKVSRKLSGEEKEDERILEGYLSSMEVTISSLKVIQERDERAKLIEQFNTAMSNAQNLIKRINDLKIAGVDVGHDPKGYEERLKKLIRDFRGVA